MKHEITYLSHNTLRATSIYHTVFPLVYGCEVFLKLEALIFIGWLKTRKWDEMPVCHQC